MEECKFEDGGDDERVRRDVMLRMQGEVYLSEAASGFETQHPVDLHQGLDVYFCNKRLGHVGGDFDRECCWARGTLME